MITKPIGARSVVLLIVASAFCLPTRAQQPPQFEVNCTLPFADIAPAHDPFVNCGNCGVASKRASPKADVAKAYESNAKNDFCAATSRIAVVNFSILRAMQKASPKGGNLADRTILHDFFTTHSGTKLGEGDVVKITALILNAHVSDCKTGENVNCSKSGFSNNDIHIPLLDPTAQGGRSQSECSSVTAEISPHFRPEVWANLDMNTPIKNVVRVTGPLFYDNSHKPCLHITQKSKGDAAPYRSSLWEVHPVYKLEVCLSTNLGQCDVASDSTAVWIPYDKWVAMPGTVTNATGAAQRKACSQGRQTAVVSQKCPI